MKYVNELIFKFVREIFFHLRNRRQVKYAEHTQTKLQKDWVVLGFSLKKISKTMAKESEHMRDQEKRMENIVFTRACVKKNIKWQWLYIMIVSKRMLKTMVKWSIVRRYWKKNDEEYRLYRTLHCFFLILPYDASFNHSLIFFPIQTLIETKFFIQFLNSSCLGKLCFFLIVSISPK